MVVVVRWSLLQSEWLFLSGSLCYGSGCCCQAVFVIEGKWLLLSGGLCNRRLVAVVVRWSLLQEVVVVVRWSLLLEVIVVVRWSSFTD